MEEIDMSRIDKGSNKWPESKDPTDRKYPHGWKYPHLPGINMEDRGV